MTDYLNQIIAVLSPYLNTETVQRTLTDLTTRFDALGLSPNALIAIAVGLAIVFLVALREAASWFLKIDSLKRDVKRLTKTIAELEVAVNRLSLPGPGVTPDLESESAAQAPELPEPPPPKHGGFPITH